MVLFSYSLKKNKLLLIFIKFFIKISIITYIKDMNFSKNELYKKHNNPLLAKQKFHRRTDFTNIGIPKRKNYYIGGDSTPIYYNYWYNSIIPIRNTILVPVPIAYDELNYVSVIKKEQIVKDKYLEEEQVNTEDQDINIEIESMTDENENLTSSNNFGLIILLFIVVYYYHQK